MVSYNSWGVIKMSQNVSAYKNIPIKMFIKMHLAITKPLQILNSSLNSTYVTHAHGNSRLIPEEGCVPTGVEL